jgi:hypothetical protein
MGRVIKLTFWIGVCCVFILCCSAAVVPYIEEDATGKIELTSPYIWKDSSGTEHSFNMNTEGISIKQIRKISDGSIEIYLGGSMVANGIPETLHCVPYPDNADISGTLDESNSIVSDYKIIEAQQGYPPNTSVLRNMEKAIALGAQNKDARFTVVTISGLVPHDRFITINEENDSLRLFSEAHEKEFNAISAVFYRESLPLRRIVTFYEDPNYFSNDGMLHNELVYRGSKTQKGGFNILIWNGADNKRAVYTVRNGHEVSKFIVDWNNVNFFDIPLMNVVWNATQISTVISEYNNIILSSANEASKQYVANATIKSYTSSDIDGRPPLSVAEGLAPTFSPSNATVKKFYFKDTSGIIYQDNFLELDHVRFEVADRVRVSAIKNAGTTSLERANLIIELYRENESLPVQTVQLEIKVKVEP